MKNRKLVKWLHWLTASIILYFFLVEPSIPEKGIDAHKTAALATHAGMGILLTLTGGFWTLLFWLKGPLGRPGPKLKGLLRRAHPILNKGLYYALPVMLFSGGITGLMAPFAVRGFGAVPMNFGFGNRTLHEWLSELHELVFDALLILIVAHIIFHVFRHFGLKDNALFLMLPKVMHKLKFLNVRR